MVTKRQQESTEFGTWEKDGRKVAAASQEHAIRLQWDGWTPVVPPATPVGSPTEQ